MIAHSEFSPEVRAAKFDRWDRIGVELIRADLKTGGHSFVGSDPQVQALAEEWLQRKDAERAAAPLEAPRATIADMKIDLEGAGRWFKRLWGVFRRP